MFGKTNIKFGYVDYDLAYTVITVHPEWNLIFLGRKEQSSRATWTEEKFMSSLQVSTIAMVDVKSWHGS